MLTDGNVVAPSPKQRIIHISNKLITMKKRLLPIAILIAYSAILVKVMVFKDMPIIRIGPLMLNFGGTQEGPPNLVPFKTILPYLLGEKGFLIAAINLLGNIILLLPVGFLIPFVYRNIAWKKMLAIAIAAGFAIEGMQVVLHVGIFDIDDVILNALGVMTGYWSFTIITNWIRSRKYKMIIITAIIIIAAAAAVLYVVYPKGDQPVNFVHGADTIQPDRIDTAASEVAETKEPQGKDPCNGTGGTGQIISVGDKTIIIKGGNGVDQIIKLTDKTTIRNSLRPISQSDLKIGYRVTVVINDSETASLILVCNAQSH